MSILLALVFVTACTICTGSVAGRKGRNVVAWSLIGLFFGVFGLLVAALMPSKKPAFQ